MVMRARVRANIAPLCVKRAPPDAPRGVRGGCSVCVCVCVGLGVLHPCLREVSLRRGLCLGR
eukprot:5565759-Lingulodinium_polyedra.AAC.1